MDFMNYIGLLGLLGLLGFFGRGELGKKFEELQDNINKNNTKVDDRVKGVEKVAGDANRKAQDLITESQHFATKIDTEKLSDRLKAVEKSSSAADKKADTENNFDALQQKLDEVAQVSTNLQHAVKNLEDKNFDDALQKFDERLTSNGDNIQTLANNIKTITGNIDGNFKNFADEINNLGTGLKNIDGHLTNFDERISNLETAKPVEEEQPDERLTAIEEEHKTLNERVGEYNSVLQKHHVALVQWKNNFVAIQNHFNAIQANFDEHKKIIDELQDKLTAQSKLFNEVQTKINAQPDAAPVDDELKEKLTAQENLLNEFKSKLDSQPAAAPVDDELKEKLTTQENLLNDVKSQIDAQENFFTDLKEKLAAQSTLLDEFKSKFDEEEKLLGEFKTKFDAQDKILDEHDERFGKQESLFFSFKESIDELEKVFEEMAGDQFLTIENFDLKPTGRVFFTNKPTEVFENLKVAGNLSGLTTFLESSDFDKKDNFIRILENYRQNLKKVSDKVRRKKFNEDALSEEVTEAFFNTLSKHFLATIPISIYRGARQETLETLDAAEQAKDFKFYSDFLAKVNEYLAACHVYTAPIVPKSTMTSTDIDRMSVTRKDTEIPDEDNVIDEVERLPYYMDYVSENGEVENFCSEGKMVVLKYDGGGAQ